MTGKPSAAAQLTLEFPRLDPDQRPLIETDPYRAPLALLRRWSAWPDGQLALIGEKGAGKSRLLRSWAVEVGAAVTTGQALAAAQIDEISQLTFSALAIDDAECGANGLGLLAALNLCRARLAPVLLTGRGEPSGWYDAPGDLRSRLQALPISEIGAPDDDTLAQRLAEECELRHLRIPDESIRYLAQRMERSWLAVTLVADQVERTKGRAETLRSARNVLIALGVDPG
ncbi:MAG: DNA replication ATPase [Hyphomonadaceae bacterium]